MPMKLKGWYIEPDRSSDYTGDLVDPHTGVVTHPPSMTKQEFVAECDINNIIREYSMTGQINHMAANAALGAFQDLPGGLDFQEAMNTVVAGQNAFALLPSQVRDRFNNDPEEFLAFFGNPANNEEAIRLGLATPKPAPPDGNLGEAVQTAPAKDPPA